MLTVFQLPQITGIRLGALSRRPVEARLKVEIENNDGDPSEVYKGKAAGFQSATPRHLVTHSAIRF
jgi:hypothetical protein